MAPAAKAMKRPAAAQEGAQKKAKKQEDPAAANCQAVSAAVLAAESVPKDALRMLAASVKTALAKPKAERHRFEEQVIKMIEEVLTASEAGCQAKVAGLETKVGEAGAEKATREALAEAAAAGLAAKASARDAARAALAVAGAELRDAAAQTREAEKAQKEGDEAYNGAAANKATLEAMLAGDYASLKETPSAKALKCFAKLCRDFGFDGHLVTAAESTLGKPPAERGTFDNLVVEQLDEQLGLKIAAFAEEVASGEPGKAERAACAEAAKAAQEAAAAKEAACKAEAAGAEAALKEIEGERRSAVKSLKDFGAEMKQVGADLSAAKGELAESTAVLVALQELVEGPAAEAPPAEAEAEAEAEAKVPAEAAEPVAAAIEP